MRVQSAFATALYWQRVVQAREEDVRSAANGVALAQARLAAGDTIPAEVAQAEMELRRAELERDNAMSRVAQTLDVLGATLGMPRSGGVARRCAGGDPHGPGTGIPGGTSGGEPVPGGGRGRDCRAAGAAGRGCRPSARLT